MGAPSDRFLWPLELVNSPDGHTFGYIMPLREPRFEGIVDLVKRRAEPTFRALCTAGFELADGYLQLQAQGPCYGDISFGNVLLDPDTGQVRICDNDNVTVTGLVAFLAPFFLQQFIAPRFPVELPVSLW